ncbi:RmlC-like cupin [Mycena leptocephala]|nr:RmlC-like cupin [Mycena leptocephala]
MLSFTTILLASILGSAFASPVDSIDLVGKLRLAATAVDRINLLPNDTQFVFNFFDPAAKAAVGAGGKIVTANAATFPAVVGNGAAMAVGFLDGCSINTPHTHPRATEIQFSVNGTIRTGMITENNSRFIMTEIKPGGITIFPRVPSTSRSTKDATRPCLLLLQQRRSWVLQAGQRFLGLSPDVVAATLGDIGVEAVMGLDAIIPTALHLEQTSASSAAGKHARRNLPPAPVSTPGNAFPAVLLRRPTRPRPVIDGSVA